MMHDAPMFSLSGMVVDGFVNDVYDGDSIKVVFPIHGNYYKWNLRLNGADSPEIRTRDHQEKLKGFASRDALKEKIAKKHVILKLYDFDKYGRLLGDVYLEDENINEWLIKNGHAIVYL